MALEITVRKIVHRWSGTVLWEGDASSTKDALEKASDAGANLRGANLAGANLAGANLTDADLRDANLAGANLTDADLTDANLAGANLAGANLAGANLTDANLTDANLRDANLRDANLAGANLAGANLAGANLTDANLRDANLMPIRDDLWAVLSAAPTEAAGLLAAVREGRIDGSAYVGACACLIGTIANIRGCNYQALGILRPNASRPAEKFFLAIRQGDTTETNPFAKLAAEWISDWLERMQQAFAATARENR